MIRGRWVAIFLTLAAVIVASANAQSVTLSFDETFESRSWFGDLFPAWSGFQRQNGKPHTPSISIVHLGESNAIQFVAPPATGGAVVKAAIYKEGLFYPKGSDLWLTARIFVVRPPGGDNRNLYLIDMEDYLDPSSPGVRIALNDGGCLAVNSKITQETIGQSPITFPTGTFVSVRVHLLLDDVTGSVQVWQDGAIVIDRAARTLLKASSVVNRVTIGVTASLNPQGQTVYFDDVMVVSAVN